MDVVCAARATFLASQPIDVVTTDDTYVINGLVYARVSRVIDAICGKFTGVPKTAAIGAAWEQARVDGVEMHACIESWLNVYIDSNGANADDDLENVGANQVREWVKSSGLIPVVTELLVVSAKRGYAGRVDCIMYDPIARNFCVVDWKRVAVLRPHHLSRYTRQLRLYRFALEEMFPYIAFGAAPLIVHAHDELTSYDGARATIGLSLSDDDILSELGVCE